MTNLSDPTGSGDTTKATASRMDTSPDDNPFDVTAPDGAATGRRGFLKLGGLGVAVAAFAAACVQQVKVTDKMAQTGTIVPAPATSVPPFPGSAEMDATFALTAISLEKLLVETYDQVFTANWIGTASFVTAAKALRDQHEDHLPELETLARSLGQDPSAVNANQTVKEEEVDTSVDAIDADAGDKAKAEIDAVTLLILLEDTIAQMYAKAGGESTTRELRAQFSALGSTEARHYTVLAGMIGRPAAPFSFEHTAPAALTDEAWVDPNKPVKSTASTPGSTKPA